MLYKYSALTTEGEKKSGSIQAPNIELAISSLQNNNLIISSIKPDEGNGGFFSKKITFFQKIKNREIVILSRQLSTLFEAKVSALASFKLLSEETKNEKLSLLLRETADDLEGGVSMSQALSKHPEAFSKFYVSMIKSGEESGNLEESFSYLADYLDRSYELNSKARNALIYPAFVIVSFLIVLILMMIFVMPKLLGIIKEAGQEMSFYTKFLIGTSEFFTDYGLYLLIFFIIGMVFLWKYSQTFSGKRVIARLQISTFAIGSLYTKFYVSRIIDNLGTSLSSGISAVRALEISADIAGNSIYSDILMQASNEVRAGSSISATFSKYKEIPSIVSQMIKIGEETGKLNFILKTLARFYKKEVDNAVDNIVTLIEPAMIIFLGVAVGFFIISIIGPIYNMTSGV